MDILILDKIFVLDNFKIVLDKKYFVWADGQGKSEYFSSLYSQIPGNHNEERDQNLTAKKKKSIKMMTAVVVIFGICWFPFFVFKMVKIFWTPFEK